MIYLIITKGYVCKFAGMLFRCRQDADDFKNIHNCFGCKNQCFKSKISITRRIFLLAGHHLLQSVQNGWLMGYWDGYSCFDYEYIFEKLK